MCSSVDRATYYNRSLVHSSFIDHLLVSNNVHHLIQSMFMADSGANLSDHRSLVGHFRLHDLLVHTRTPRTNHDVNTVLPAWRWDKPDIGLYYENSRQALSQVSLPVSCYSCAMGCNNITHQNVINNYYIVYNVS